MQVPTPQFFIIFHFATVSMGLRDFFGPNDHNFMHTDGTQTSYDGNRAPSPYKYTRFYKKGRRKSVSLFHALIQPCCSSSRILAKHSLQYTGRSDLGSKGTFASPPQRAQVAVKYSRGPRAAALRASRQALQRWGSFLAQSRMDSECRWTI